MQFISLLFFFSLLFLFKNLQALYSNYTSIFFIFFKNLFILIEGSLLYNIVVVLPYIDMN